MKNISYSQYKRQLQDDSTYEEPDASLIECVEPPTESTSLVHQVEMLNWELQKVKMRERLMRSANDNLTNALAALKVPELSSRQVLEECKGQLRRIRELLMGSHHDHITREDYHELLEHLREEYDRDRQRIQQHYEEQLMHATTHARHELENELRAQGEQLEKKLKQQSTSQFLKVRNGKINMSMISPKQLNFDSVTRPSSSRLEPLSSLASPSESISSHRNENMPRPAAEMVRSPNGDLLGSGRLSNKSQKEVKSRHTRRNSAIEMSFAGPKNIATDLLCDICGVSYSPIQFFSHVEMCKHPSSRFVNNQSRQSMKRILQQHEDEGQSESLEKMQELLKQKAALEYRIEMLRSSNGDHGPQRERLQTDLDQIVYIIKNKGVKVERVRNQNDLKRLVGDDKQNRNISIYKVNVEQGRSSSRLGLGSAFTRKTTVRKDKDIKQSRARK